MAFKDLLGHIYKLLYEPFVEHSVKGQFHKGQMISDIYIWRRRSHRNVYIEQKALQRMSKHFSAR